MNDQQFTDEPNLSQDELSAIMSKLCEYAEKDGYCTWAYQHEGAEKGDFFDFRILKFRNGRPVVWMTESRDKDKDILMEYSLRRDRIIRAIKNLKEEMDLGIDHHDVGKDSMKAQKIIMDDIGKLRKELIQMIHNSPDPVKIVDAFKFETGACSTNLEIGGEG